MHPNTTAHPLSNSSAETNVRRLSFLGFSLTTLLSLVLSTQMLPFAHSAIAQENVQDQQEELDKAPPPPPPSGARDRGQARTRDDEENGRGGPRRRGRFSGDDSFGQGIPAGEFDFHVEIKPAEGDRPMQVLVNGETVNPRTAYFFMHLLRQKDPAQGGAVQIPDTDHPPTRGNRERVDDGNRPNGSPPREDIRSRASVVDDFFDRDGVIANDANLNIVMQVIKDLDTNLYSRMLEIQSTSAQRFNTDLRRFAFEHADLIRDLVRDPDRYELRLEDQNLHKALQEIQLEIAFGAKIEEGSEAWNSYRRRLQRIISAQFDVKQSFREYELEKMSKRLEAFRERLQMRANEKDTHTESQVDELMADAIRGKN